MLETKFIYYFIIINILAFITFGMDKQKAIKHQYRVPERNLFILAIIGGGVGAILGMYFFHHKTKKWYFCFGIPVIIIIQVAAFLRVFIK
ncbi:MAG: DUF1294 domain-containing protein [Anaerostipes sp.]|nr:DUF1294 domain-containing protein [Anaerostipes sp.]